MKTECCCFPGSAAHLPIPHEKGCPGCINGPLYLVGRKLNQRYKRQLAPLVSRLNKRYASLPLEQRNVIILIAAEAFLEGWLAGGGPRPTHPKVKT